MALKELGLAGASGWRARVAETLERPVARRTPLRGDQVRALVGGLFFVLSAVYVAKTLGRLGRQG